MEDQDAVIEFVSYVILLFACKGTKNSAEKGIKKDHFQALLMLMYVNRVIIRKMRYYL